MFCVQPLLELIRGGFLRFILTPGSTQPGWDATNASGATVTTVPRRAIAFVARRVYGERYAAVPMQHELVSADAAGGTGSLAYRWRTAAGWNSVAASFGGAAREATPGSREEFITEHYWGYAASRRGSLEYRVEHPRWRLWDAREPALACDVATVYGEPFAEALSAPPSSAFVADGSEIVVRQGVRIA